MRGNHAPITNDECHLHVVVLVERQNHKCHMLSLPVQRSSSSPPTPLPTPSHTDTCAAPKTIKQIKQAANSSRATFEHLMQIVWGGSGLDWNWNCSNGGRGRGIWNGARIVGGLGKCGLGRCHGHLAGCFYGLCLKLIGVHVAGIKRLQFL